MMNDDIDYDIESEDELARALALDETMGPAPRVSTRSTDALVASVLDAWQASLPAPSSETTEVPAEVAEAVKTAAGTGAVVKLATVLLLVGSGAYLGFSSDSGTAPAVARAEVAAPAAVAVAPTKPSLLSPAPNAEGIAPPAAVEAHAPRVRSNADLLAQANELRRSGRYAQAASVYQAVVEASPGSRDAHVARIAAASIKLDRLHDARGAARLFRAAMRGSSGALAAEATFGLARAARQLGDGETEIMALEALRSRHASSPYALMAERRLGALTGARSEPAPE
jgi:tetratricopeptide (TPR) repeat protein